MRETGEVPWAEDAMEAADAREREVRSDARSAAEAAARTAAEESRERETCLSDERDALAAEVKRLAGELVETKRSFATTEQRLSLIHI